MMAGAEGQEGRRGSLWVFWLPVLFGLTFGAGVCAGTITRVDEAVARALQAQAAQVERLEAAMATRAELAEVAERIEACYTDLRRNWYSERYEKAKEIPLPR